MEVKYLNKWDDRNAAILHVMCIHGEDFFFF